MYGVRLWSDLGTDRLPWREFAVLLRQLPDQSRFRVAFTDGESAWSTTDHLLALTIDVLQVANWQRSSSKKKPQPRPKPIDRPADMAKRRQHTKARREKWQSVKQRARERMTRG